MRRPKEGFLEYKTILVSLPKNESLIFDDWTFTTKYGPVTLHVKGGFFRRNEK